MAAYYNEIDPYAAQWLRNLIAAGHIAPGDVDERSIVDVQADDLKGYTQCHFFAGIGGWSYAARLAGYPDDRGLWTGSCPCQPFSVAGSGKGQADERHLWPIFFALISARRPNVVMGEQVAAAVGKDWLDGVHSDLESIGYACGATVVPACAVDAPHRRDRLWFVADAKSRGLGTDRRSQETERNGGFGYPDFSGSGTRRSMADTESQRRDRCESATEPAGRLSPETGDSALSNSTSSSEPNQFERAQPSNEGRPVLFIGPVPGASSGSDDWFDAGRGSNSARCRSPWAAAEWLIGADGKARRVEPSIRLLAHGIPARVGKLRAYGNAIVPQVAAEVIGAYMEISA